MKLHHLGRFIKLSAQSFLKAIMAFEDKTDREAREFLASNPDVVTIDMLVPDMNGILRGSAAFRWKARWRASTGPGARLPRSLPPCWTLKEGRISPTHAIFSAACWTASRKSG